MNRCDRQQTIFILYAETVPSGLLRSFSLKDFQSPAKRAEHVIECHLEICNRADSRFVPSQWETTLLCNDVSHWLGASLESTLCEMTHDKKAMFLAHQHYWWPENWAVPSITGAKFSAALKRQNMTFFKDFMHLAYNASNPKSTLVVINLF